MNVKPFSKEPPRRNRSCRPKKEMELRETDGGPWPPSGSPWPPCTPSRQSAPTFTSHGRMLRRGRGALGREQTFKRSSMGNEPTASSAESPTSNHRDCKSRGISRQVTVGQHGNEGGQPLAVLLVALHGLLPREEVHPVAHQVQVALDVLLHVGRAVVPTSRPAGGDGPPWRRVPHDGTAPPPARGCLWALDPALLFCCLGGVRPEFGSAAALCPQMRTMATTTMAMEMAHDVNKMTSSGARGRWLGVSPEPTTERQSHARAHRTLLYMDSMHFAVVDTVVDKIIHR